ncbi:MAG: hypothetical protein CM15mV72_330 [uncultured marine virus]|nr:MAG: hypothetical protein CM15mV72_330 [uncultured marine virus]
MALVIILLEAFVIGEKVVDKATQQVNADFEGVNKKRQKWLEEHADEIEGKWKLYWRRTGQQEYCKCLNEKKILKDSNLLKVLLAKIDQIKLVRL